MDPKEIVQRGYDKISYKYRSDDGRFMSSDYAGWLADLNFELLWTRFIPEGDGGHTLLLAKKGTI